MASEVIQKLIVRVTCDRCGSTFDREGHIDHDRVTHCHGSPFPDDLLKVYGDTGDLCDACAASYRNWWGD